MKTRLTITIESVNQLELDLANCDLKQKARVISEHQTETMSVPADSLASAMSWDILRWLELKLFQQEIKDKHETDCQKTFNKRIPQCYGVIGFYESREHIKKFKANYSKYNFDTKVDLKELIKLQREIILSEYILKAKIIWLSRSEKKFSAEDLLVNAIKNYRNDGYKATILNYEIIWLATKAIDADSNILSELKKLFSNQFININQFKIYGTQDLLTAIRYGEDDLSDIVCEFLVEKGGESCYIFASDYSLGTINDVFNPDPQFLGLPVMKDYLIKSEKVIDDLSVQVWEVFNELERPVIQVPPVVSVETTPLILPEKNDGFRHWLKTATNSFKGFYNVIKQLCCATKPDNQDANNKPLLRESAPDDSTRIMIDSMGSVSSKAVVPPITENKETTSPVKSPKSALRGRSIVCSSPSDNVTPEELGVSFPRQYSPSSSLSPRYT